VIVAVSAPVAVPVLRKLSPASCLVVWNHHAPDQPDIQPLARPEVLRELDLVVYLSEWQRAATERRLGVRPRSAVVGNGVTPSFENMFTDVADLKSAKQWRAAYTSAPFRGLDVLVDVYRSLVSPPTLDVFSSMRVYRGDDTPFRALYADAQTNSAIRYHGSVPQTELASAMRRVSFFCYPCTFPETFCIAALEAMAAGAWVVSTHMGALASTSMGFATLMPVSAKSRDEFVGRYRSLYSSVLRDYEANRDSWAERMMAQSHAVNRCATWRHRAADWDRLLNETIAGRQAVTVRQPAVSWDTMAEKNLSKSDSLASQ
jgi:glycosyltransferase involved in cell wall biosynthesis